MNNRQIAAKLLRIASQLVSARSRSNKVIIQSFKDGDRQAAKNLVIALLQRKRLVYTLPTDDGFVIIGGAPSAKAATQWLRRQPQYDSVSASLDKIKRIKSPDDLKRV